MSKASGNDWDQFITTWQGKINRGFGRSARPIPANACSHSIPKRADPTFSLYTNQARPVVNFALAYPAQFSAFADRFHQYRHEVSRLAQIDPYKAGRTIASILHRRTDYGWNDEPYQNYVCPTCDEENMHILLCRDCGAAYCDCCGLDYCRGCAATDGFIELSTDGHIRNRVY